MIQARKVPRDDRPDPHATEDLQQFLRNELPPEDFWQKSVKRTSGISTKSLRGREFLRNLLRTRSTSTPSILRDSVLNTGNVPHNCVILKQEVPGKRTEYYRIVRDSSQFDSLETKSTFQVNYEFPRHDVGVGGLDRKTKTDSKKKSDSESSVLEPRARFHIRPRFLNSNSSKRRPAGTERANLSTTTEEMEQSLQGFPAGPQPLNVVSINHSIASARMETQDLDTMEPKASTRRQIENAPQIQEFIPTASFPASDLISTWGKRRSRKSPMSSPHKAAVSSLISLTQATTTSQLARARLHRYKYDIQNNRQRTSNPQSPAKPPRQLASPIKLRRGQQIASRGVPRFKINSKNDREAPSALRSNPSRSNEELLSQISETQQPIAKVPQAKNPARIVKTYWERSGIECSAGMQGFGDLTTTPSPVKRLRSNSIENCPPTTPAPTLPLPPLPEMSLARGLDMGSTIMNKNSPENCQSTNSVLPYRTIATITPQISPQKLEAQVSSEAIVCNHLTHDPPQDQSSTQGDKDIEPPNDPNATHFSKINWPQPPSSRPNSADHPATNISRSSWELSEDDPFLNRRQRTTSLKRKHLQQAQQQSLASDHNNIPPPSSTSQTGSQSIIELPSTRSSQPEYLDIVFGQSAAGSEYTESIPDRTLAKVAASKLGFTDVKTLAEIRPLTGIRVHDYQSVSGRTIYRSHSTQMSVDKGGGTESPLGYKPANGISREGSPPGTHYLAPQLQHLPSPEQEVRTTIDDIPLNCNEATKDKLDNPPTNIEKLIMDMMHDFKAELTAIRQRMDIMEIAIIASYKL